MTQDPDLGLEREIAAAVASMRDDAVRRLSELVALPSLLGEEAAAQAWMADAMGALGLRVDRFDIDEARLRTHPGWSPSIVSYDGRPNVVGVHLPGEVRGRSLILNGHIDVVPTGHDAMWTTPPFSPRVDGDRLYGRGAADMKAGIVAYLTAFRALRALGLEPAAPVYLQSVIEEECTGNGALACLVQGYHADAAVIPEPGEAILVGQLGVMWLTLEVTGVPVHAMVAHTGTNAIDAARNLFAELKLLEREWNEPARRHPLWCAHQHPINFNLGRLVGGEWASSVATHCRAEIRLSFYPDMTRERVKAAVEARLAEAHAAMAGREGIRWSVTYRGFQSEGCVLDRAQPLVTELAATHRDATGREVELVVGTGTTDARSFNLYGPIPATCYGPRGADIHGIDEWVSIDSTMQVTEVLARFVARWCGTHRRRR
ncbi:MAG TPA: ArgE/DapE family deacylase [Burkholderiaceae bacterium]|nr:ArgE/DapE family deacylase [Burkholderiaceae bacterium]